MAEQEKTAVQSKAEEVYLLLKMRLVAAQNLLRSLRKDHAEQCRLIRLGIGGDLDRLVERMREIEKKILAMQRLLVYAEAKVEKAAMENEVLELPVSSSGNIRSSSIQLTQKAEGVTLNSAQRLPACGPGQLREVYGSL